MTTKQVPYPNPGVPLFDVLDTYGQSFLFVGSDPKPLVTGGFAFEQNQSIPAFTPVGFNARHKLVPATVSDATTYFVANAAVNAPGSGGTTGVQTVTGTTGTGTKFQASVNIVGGAITSINSISVEGAYTVQPTTPTAEPVTGGGLTGATLNLTMEALEIATPVIQAQFITTEAITTAVGNDTTGIPVWFGGCFNIRALNWDSSFATDADKYRAFFGAPTPTNILIKKRQSDV